MKIIRSDHTTEHTIEDDDGERYVRYYSSKSARVIWQALPPPYVATYSLPEDYVDNLEREFLVAQAKLDFVKY